MDRSFGICNLSVVPMRAEPSDKAEIKTQLLFGDRFEVLESIPKWTRIVTVYDNYEAWIDPKQYTPLHQDDFDQFATSRLSDLSVGQYLIKKSTGEKLYLPPGSSMPVSATNQFFINDEEYEFYGNTISPDSSEFLAGVESAARFYLHAPYLWGGKTLFGIDCSGLTQMVFKLFDIKINRDARQQADQGQAVDFLSTAQTGDLAFFDDPEGRIIHVGIMLGNSKIIHASGRVKIDRIDDQGIYSAELGRYTHKLRIVKRFI